MSERHRQMIRANRDVLVECLLPDDIFNDLISKRILTTADVSRIKVCIKQTCLVHVLCICAAWLPFWVQNMVLRILNKYTHIWSAKIT